MEQIKQNLPVILLLTIVPYFFYSDPSLPQAIIAAVLAGMAGFKYYLESQELPNYVEMFQKQIDDHKKEVERNFRADYVKVMEEMEALRKQHNVQSINRNVEKKINLQGW